MIQRSSLKWPITLGVVLLVLIVGLLVLWVIGQAATQQWAMLTVGTIFIALVLIGVVLYLILSIKEVRLNLRQANFIDSVTHELKSPIASIKLYLQTLDMRQVDPEQQREFHKFMLDDVQRLDSLIDHLLVAARLGHLEKEDEPPLEELPLDQLTRACVETIRRRYELADDQVALDLQPCVSLGRSQDVEMILTNLLDNAVKYAGQPSKIDVHVGLKGPGRVLVRISDNGKGVRFEFRRKIFERFFRGGSELERTAKGTGLGLYIVRSLVAKMHGKVTVHGRGPLRGATFEVDLPGHSSEIPATPVPDTVKV
ncbi:MAG: HAMP domain-containing histidine kinase [Planctomycetales bacterium]|nr:HAMP domain-containing histidine kinase [Planctomycetales bacterium]